MKYLLILFIVMVVLSPLTWLKSSPGQRRVTSFRRRAAELGLKVQLTPEPDAEDTDKRPTTVRYTLGLQDSDVGIWILLRNSRRGWETPWPALPDWRWFRTEAKPQFHSHIATLLASLPEQVYAIRADQAGVSVYLRETGEPTDVDKIALSLKNFQQSLCNPLPKSLP